MSIWEGSELIPGVGMNSDHSIRLCRGRVRADPRRQDQLMLKTEFFGTESELIPAGRISSYLKKITWQGFELVREGMISSYLKKFTGQGLS